MDAPVYHLEHVLRSREELEDFNGPLDLILHLLSKNKMEIRDIQISLILEQYLEWIEQRTELDLEVASEFVTMASHLVYIKTRMLLSIRDEEAASEMEQLIASLEARQRHENYEKIKALVPALEQRFRIGRDYLPRQPEVLPAEHSYRYTHRPQDLQRAMEQIFSRGEGTPAPPVHVFQGIVGHEPYPVQSKIRQVFSQILQAGMLRFRQLFRGNRSRSEIVATFLAVLELCKRNHITIEGSDTDCTVTEGENPVDENALPRTPELC